ncbi:MAG: M28 family peptidase [Clostridia bacterium]|nr:M28 family peptidase [Clostridia bacterium]
MNLRGVCDYISQKHPVRFNREQKDVFSVYLSHLFAHCGFDPDKVAITKMRDSVENNNIIVGDPKKAEYYVTAHYDTPGRTGFLFSSAKLLGKALSWILLFVIILVLALGFVFALTHFYPNLPYWHKFGLCFGLLVLMVLFFVVIPGLTPNKNNANTSSGLFAVISMAERVAADPELKDKTCFVVFDNSEWGALGASAFAKWCKKKGIGTENKKVFCLDHLGSGDKLTLCAASKKSAESAAYKQLEKALSDSGVEFEKLTDSTFITGDNVQFKNSVMISRLNHSRLGPVYIPDVATKKDTACNIEAIENIGNIICDAIKNN